MKAVVPILTILVLAATAFPQTCPPCWKNSNPQSGRGPARNLPADIYMPCNCSDDNRRVMTVYINSSWNVDANGNSTPGHTNENIWNAVNCALAEWNSAQDQFGNKTGYFFVLDQSHQFGDPVIKIKKGRTSVGNFAVTSWMGTAPNLTDPVIELDPRNRNLNNNRFTPADLCGRVKHELGHIIGLADDVNCTSIMSGSDTNGRRPYNNISSNDVVQSNNNLNNNQTNCAGCFPGTTCEVGGGGGGDEGGGDGGSEPTCDFRSYLAFEDCDIFESPQCCDKYLITEEWCNGVLVRTNREYAGNTCQPEL